jgi:hypothetical protein
MVTELLDAREAKGRHTGVHISAWLQEMLGKMKIDVFDFVCFIYSYVIAYVLSEAECFCYDCGSWI